MDQKISIDQLKVVNACVSNARAVHQTSVEERKQHGEILNRPALINIRDIDDNFLEINIELNRIAREQAQEDLERILASQAETAKRRDEAIE